MSYAGLFLATFFATSVWGCDRAVCGPLKLVLHQLKNDLIAQNQNELKHNIAADNKVLVKYKCMFKRSTKSGKFDRAVVLGESIHSSRLLVYHSRPSKLFDTSGLHLVSLGVHQKRCRVLAPCRRGQINLSFFRHYTGRKMDESMSRILVCM